MKQEQAHLLVEMELEKKLQFEQRKQQSAPYGINFFNCLWLLALQVISSSRVRQQERDRERERSNS